MKRSNGWALFDVTALATLLVAGGICGVWIYANSGVAHAPASAIDTSDLSIGNKKAHFRFTESDIQPMVATMASAGISNFIVWIDPNTGALDVVTDIDHKPHLDLKPGSCPNSVNVSNGAFAPGAVMSAGLLGNAFDVTQVDVGSVRLSPVILQDQGTEVELTPVHISFEDVGSPFESDNCACAALGPDGILDIAIHFDRQEMIDGFGLQSLANNTEFPLKVTGMINEGRAIFGTRDCIRILNH